MLEHLDRGNLFLVPLDDTRRWYRYHHLFAEVLRTHVLEGRREDVADLTGARASGTTRRANLSPPSATLSRPVTSTGRPTLPSSPCRALQRDRQEETMVSWLALFPDEVVQARPVLALGFIAALMSNGQFAGVEERLRDLEQRLPAPAPDGRTERTATGNSGRRTGTSGTGCPEPSSCTGLRSRSSAATRSRPSPTPSSPSPAPPRTTT